MPRMQRRANQMWPTAKIRPPRITIGMPTRMNDRIAPQNSMVSPITHQPMAVQKVRIWKT